MEGNGSEYKDDIGACKECGNSPVNHFATYVIQTFDVWAGGRMQWMSNRMWYRRFARRWRMFASSFERINYPFAHMLGIVRFANDPTKAASYRSQVIWEEANRRGIPMQQIVLFGRYTDVYRAHIRGAWIYFESLPKPPWLPQEADGWIDDKFLLHEALKQVGVPTPSTYSVMNAERAVDAFRRIGAPVAIKPRAGSRGRHTTTCVRTEDDVRRGFKSAQMLCHVVLVQQHLVGGVCRGTVVGGKLAGFFQAFPPHITGDGVSSIRELIAAQNARKPERVGDIVLNNEHLDFIARLGYTSDSVLDKGETIDLTHRTGRFFGGETRELLQTVHPSLKNYLEKAAQTLDVPIVGFDLIIPDPEKDPENQTWGIIEANTLPFIDLHYLSLHGEPSNVASAVWDLWNENDATLTR